MSVTARRARERIEIREKILESARRLLAERGYDGVTMREIARQIEYSPTVIYSHFKDKHTLISALVGADYRDVGSMLRQLGAIEDPLARLRFFGERLTEYALDSPNVYRAIAMTSTPEGGPASTAEPDDGDFRADAHSLVLGSVREAIQRGLLRPDIEDSELVAQTFLGGIHGIIAMHLTMGEDHWVQWRPVQARVGLLLDALLAGLARPGPVVATTAGTGTTTGHS